MSLVANTEQKLCFIACQDPNQCSCVANMMNGGIITHIENPIVDSGFRSFEENQAIMKESRRSLHSYHNEIKEQNPDFIHLQLNRTWIDKRE